MRNAEWHRSVSNFGLALAMLLLSSGTAYASLDLTTTTSAVSLVEGTSPSLVFTLANSGPDSVTLVGTGIAGRERTFISGDLTDQITSFSFGNATCSPGETLTAGQSCEFTAVFGTDTNAGETDGDFGVDDIRVYVDYTPDSSTILSAETTVRFTVYDSPEAVPEPTSFILLLPIIGLFAVGISRRKFQFSRA